ncbi:uncharacterized protein LOC110731998 [Chenopodium quinoa]|uniref:uncharacterized protein LOC110731998 n=1 Tax=Chenopodium quinoa TaxID=63459 RepID=UPI000B76C9AA|nr:uncharacterized protein LOC110731998 [Chenopodium quinoa]
MISPELREKLQLYISASKQTITVVLLVERQKQQRPIYFVSHSLTRTVMVEVLEESSITEKEQFDCNTIKDYLEDMGTKYASASVCHPQSNGQAKAANKLILTSLQRKLEEYKYLWADLVPEVSWANRTTKKESTGKSPFTLAYGADAVVPVEVQIPSLRIQHYKQQGNEKRMLEELDFLPEVRLKAALKLVAQKSRISKAFNKRVKHIELLPGDLVLRRTTAVGRGNQHGKLSAK